MRYLKTFFESTEYSIFDTEGWEKLLPLELTIKDDSGTWTLTKPKSRLKTRHAANVTGLMNGVQISYYHNTVELQGGDVTADGEPDQLDFDIDVVKVNDGTDANSDKMRLDVGITYGDSTVFQFSITSPSDVNVVHYNGYGSKYDPNSTFAFDDKSVASLVNFFNSWGFEISTDDFSFMDSKKFSFVPDYDVTRYSEFVARRQ